MLKKLLFLSVIIFFFNSCELKTKEKLKISVTTWVGYTPLFYAKEKGWLEPLNIKLLNVVSLSENMYLYKAGNSDAYVGTQYEYNFLSNKSKDLIPIILFDRSNGGDIIMSNKTIKELQSTKNIDVYLEMDSINSILLEDFLNKYNIDDKKINYINNDQAFISRLDSKNIENPTLIVTYIPYNNRLEDNGFKEIASTKESLDLLVIDALYTNQDTFIKFEKEFIKLKEIIDKSIKNLQENPKEYYEKIKIYLPDTNYEEFKNSLNDIIWINKDIDKILLQRLKNTNLPIKDIIK